MKSRENSFQGWKTLFWKVCLNRMKSGVTFQGWIKLFWKVCLHRMKSRENPFSGLNSTVLKSLFKSHEMLGKHFSGLENTFKKIPSILLLALKTSFSVEFWEDQTYKHSFLYGSPKNAFLSLKNVVKTFEWFQGSKGVFIPFLKIWFSCRDKNFYGITKKNCFWLVKTSFSVLKDV